jgi:hypothetical protein
MGVNWLSATAQPRGAYTPRHRSMRQRAMSREFAGNGWEDTMDTMDGTRLRAADSATLGLPADLADQAQESAVLDQLTPGEVRRILEGCALDELGLVVPELMHLVAHSSHTDATLAVAWNDFVEATRDAYALQLHMRDWSDFFSSDELGAHPCDGAVAIKMTDADEAWRLITRGALGAAHQPHR